MALTNSTVAYGTWKFDWDVPFTDKNYYYDSISFIWTDMTGKYNISGITGNMMNYAGYNILIVSQSIEGVSWSPGIKLLRWNEKSEGPLDYLLGTAKFPEGNLSSYHFKITRDYAGLFMVEVNNALLLKAQDNNVTSSEKFSFASFIGNSGFDNISVTSLSPENAFFEVDSFVTVFIIIMAVLVLIPFYKKRHAK